MRKQDLKNGMVVDVRNGMRYVLVGDAFLRDHGHANLCFYNDDLTNKISCSWDIVKIFEVCNAYDIEDIFKDENLKLIWESKKDVILKKHVMNAINNFTQWSGDYSFDGAYLKDDVIMISFKESDLIDVPLKDFFKHMKCALIDCMNDNCDEWTDNNENRWNEYEYYILPVLRVLDEIENGVKLYD